MIDGHDQRIELKSLGMALLVHMVTAFENINDNFLLDYFLDNNIFSTLLRVCIIVKWQGLLGKMFD